jgi:uncharacterized membrane protein YkoI
MRRSALLTLLLTLSAAPAWAAPAPLWGYLGLAAPRETDPDLTGFGAAKVSLPRAMADAAHARHGRVVEIGFAHDKGATYYTALVAAPDGLHPVRVDPATGRVSDAPGPGITRAMLDVAGQRDLDALRAARTSLAEAVATAEARTGGKVITAGVEQLGGIPQYYLETVENRKLGAWVVDPATGRLDHPD